MKGENSTSTLHVFGRNIPPLPVAIAWAVSCTWATPETTRDDVPESLTSSAFVFSESFHWLLICDKENSPL